MYLLDSCTEKKILKPTLLGTEPNWRCQGHEGFAIKNGWIDVPLNGLWRKCSLTPFDFCRGHSYHDTIMEEDKGLTRQCSWQGLDLRCPSF